MTVEALLEACCLIYKLLDALFLRAINDIIQSQKQRPVRLPADPAAETLSKSLPSEPAAHPLPSLLKKGSSSKKSLRFQTPSPLSGSLKDSPLPLRHSAATGARRTSSQRSLGSTDEIPFADEEEADYFAPPSSPRSAKFPEASRRHSCISDLEQADCVFEDSDEELGGIPAVGNQFPLDEEEELREFLAGLKEESVRDNAVICS